MADTTARLERGLVQVYTGDGKGKTTAALGLTWRALGAGLRVCFVQFIKGAVVSSEYGLLERLGERLTMRAFAHEYSPLIFGGAATAADRAAAQDAWEFAAEAVTSGRYDVVVLDEISNALHVGLVATADLLEALRRRPAHVEVVCTGRNAPQALIEMADLVTEMRAVRHPFDRGVRARKGIEL